MKVVLVSTWASRADNSPSRAWKHCRTHAQCLLTPRLAQTSLLLVVLLTFSLGGIWSARAAAAVVLEPGFGHNAGRQGNRSGVLENDTPGLSRLRGPGYPRVVTIARVTQPANGSVEINAQTGVLIRRIRHVHASR